MVKWIITMLSATVAIAGTGGCDDGQSLTTPTRVTLDPPLSAMLARAVQGEYRAETIYQGVLNDFGSVPPFANVLIAEERHSAAIARLYTSRGQTAPASESTVGGVPHFNSIQTACAAGVAAERDTSPFTTNCSLADLPADVRQVFTSNRNASLLNHLPALERCS